MANAAERSRSCYLKAAKGRRYLELADAAFPKLAAILGEGGTCPIRLDGYQLARNLAIRAWLAGEISTPGVPPFPRRLRVEGTLSTDVRFAVVSAVETPAVSSEPLSRLGATPAARLASLGVEWVDARRLLDAVRKDTRALGLVEYLESRYGPVFG